MFLQKFYQIESTFKVYLLCLTIRNLSYLSDPIQVLKGFEYIFIMGYSKSYRTSVMYIVFQQTIPLHSGYFAGFT